MGADENDPIRVRRGNLYSPNVSSFFLLLLASYLKASVDKLRGDKANI
jgi:hypothetical protein